MIFETRITNKFKGEIDYPSPVSGFLFKIPQDGVLIHRTADVYNILSRYSEIIFLPGREEIIETKGDANILTRRCYPGKLKCVVRPEWEEPKRGFPSCWFLNLTEIPLQSVSPDVFNQSKRLNLFMHLPVLAEVPVYSQFAKYKKYTLYPPVKQPSQMPGSLPGAFDEIEDNRLEGERGKQELDRLARMLNDWREQEKNRIKLM